MKLLIEKSNHSDITVKSIKKNCINTTYIVLDDVIEYLDSDEALKDEIVFVLRGDTIKILTKRFERLIAKILPSCNNIMLSRMYPGAYIKKGYDEAYKWNNIDNPHDYDHDVALINVDHYQNTNPSGRTISLLPYNLNAKDDDVALKIVEPYMMLKRNAWISKYAGLINFSESQALNNNVNAAIMYPYDILSPYVGRAKQYKSVKYKAKVLTENFGKIKRLMMKYE